jgi:hypothetical protein
MQRQDHLFRWSGGVRGWDHASQLVLYSDHRFISINNWSTVDDEIESMDLHDPNTVQQGYHTAKGTWKVQKETNEGTLILLEPDDWQLTQILVKGGLDTPQELVLVSGERRDHSECFVKEHVPLLYSFISASKHVEYNAKTLGYYGEEGLYLSRPSKEHKLTSIKLNFDDENYVNFIELEYDNRTKERVVAGNAINLNQPVTFSLQQHERIHKIGAVYLHDYLIKLEIETNLRTVNLGKRKGDRGISAALPQDQDVIGFVTNFENDRFTHFGLVATTTAKNKEDSLAEVIGAPEGKEFEIEPHDDSSKIIEIVGSGGSPIASIGFKYSIDRQPVTSGNADMAYIMTRLLPNEYITELHTRSNNSEITYAAFLTNLKRAIQYGTVADWQESDVMSVIRADPDEEIIGLRGRSRESVTALGALTRARNGGPIRRIPVEIVKQLPFLDGYAPIEGKNRTVKKKIVTEGVVGGHYGESFKFEPPSQESRISYLEMVHFKYAHTSLGIQYDDGEIHSAGKIDKKKSVGITLAPNEHIIEARGIFNNAKIPYLVLTTDAGNVIESGYDHGDYEFDFGALEGEEIIGFYGTANTSEIISLGTVTRPIQTKKERVSVSQELAVNQ